MDSGPVADFVSREPRGSSAIPDLVTPRASGRQHREPLTLGGLTESLVEADEVEFRTRFALGDEGRGELQGVGGSQRVTVDEVAGKVADLVRGFYLVCA